ncbi:cytochrome P450 reductase [Tanacetum coccineum]
MVATPNQAAFILSIPRRKMIDETQETLRTSAFPSTHVKASDIWKLLSDGAYIHICGDGKGMAQVEPLTLQTIVQEQGSLDSSKAAGYMKDFLY